MVTVTMDGGKLPLFIIVQGKRVRCEWVWSWTSASAHSTTGWVTVETVLRWLHFIRSLPEDADGDGIHLIRDCCAIHRCHAVRNLAERSHIRLHFIPPGLTDIMQPLDCSVFGPLKAEYRAICWGDVAHREDKHLTKADFAGYLMLTWESSQRRRFAAVGHATTRRHAGV
jgi:hypothetical protein